MMRARQGRPAGSWRLALAAGLASCGGKRTGDEPAAFADGGRPPPMSVDLTPAPEGGFPDEVEPDRPVAAGPADKVDLLLMIDNSISMADKQRILAEALPDLTRRLPVADLHIGVVTSSLGSSAADTCGDGHSPATEQDNDHGLLLGARPRAAHLGLAPHGFLAWRPGTGEGTHDSLEALDATFRDLVLAAGERGCGFEESLEAWYRFLVDPTPPQAVQPGPCRNQPQAECATPMGINEDILRQRAAFLRPDSVLAIVLLSDEDDCSTPITGQSWLALQNIDVPRATSVCATNPNDPCCHSCGERTPEGCAQDPACSDTILPRDVDRLNQRCFAQKQRFGIDFKYPTSRYVNALTGAVLCNHPRVPDLDRRKCPSDEFLFRNPIYTDLTNTGRPIRSPERVFFAAIVGVPWQNLRAPADEDGNPHPAGELHYKTHAQMVRDGTWDDILGDPEASPPVPPAEPLMIESLQPRGGTTRSTGEPLAPPSAGYMENSINGHEWNNSQLDDLQYACIFRLPESAHRDCAEVDYRQVSCDCHTEWHGPGEDTPLCQNPDGSYGTVQRYAKAYPGPRFLKVAKDYGERSVVASICARNLEDPAAQDYGYRPAIEALLDRMKNALLPP